MLVTCQSENRVSTSQNGFYHLKLVTNINSTSVININIDLLCFNITILKGQSDGQVSLQMGKFHYGLMIHCALGRFESVAPKMYPDHIMIISRFTFKDLSSPIREVQKGIYRRLPEAPKNFTPGQSLFYIRPVGPF